MHSISNRFQQRRLGQRLAVVLTTYQRRQEILTHLQRKSGARVSDLARLLRVSEGTVRNDLRILTQDGQLTRVRGGAVLPDDQPVRSAAFALRLRTQQDAKKCIARCAADLIVDGDSLLLDASSTVYHLAAFLRNRHQLTVVTNGIQTAQAFAADPSNTVILLGGVMRPDGDCVAGSLSERILADLHAKIAFVSCSGFSLEAGLTEVDLYEVELKRKMTASAEQLVVLVDASKFGRVYLTAFAGIEQVSRVYTDQYPGPEVVERLRPICQVTVCRDTLEETPPRRIETAHTAASQET